MLVLTRRVREAIIIDDHISITLLGIYGNQVKLGIHAPNEVSIHREEVYRKIQPVPLSKASQKTKEAQS